MSSTQLQLSFINPTKSNVALKTTTIYNPEKDGDIKTPVRSPLIHFQLKNPLVIEYMAQLSQMELVAFEVACSHLPMFNIIKCNGFQKWKKTKDN